MISILPFDRLGALHVPLFTKRYDMFVEERGWRDLERPDGLDIDQYDGKLTTYIIKQIDDEIVGGARLRPTTYPHMLRDDFSFLCADGAPPTGAFIFECSRIFVARRHPQRRRIWGEVLLAAAEFCVANDVIKLVGITELWQLNSYLAAGLEAKPLGAPHEHNGMTLLAVAFDVDEQVRDSLRAKLKAG